jgi:ubiquinone/menaquinone biosynthesis C-methylase UbiE
MPWDLVSAAYADEVVPLFERYAGDALKFARVERGQHVVDVATGPGTLAFQAVRLGARVSAIDFSPEMIKQLQDRAAREGVDAIEARLGDGMALPYEDASFDAGFSMFGLIFFPDRDRGFRELRRVVRKGRRVVVASWAPFDRVPLLQEVMDALRAEMPALPFGNNKAPLGLPSEFRDEMSASGFSNVEVHEVSYDLEAPSLAEFWAATARTMAPLVMLRKKLGEDAWATTERGIRERLLAKLPDGPQRAVMLANLGVGVV